MSDTGKEQKNTQSGKLRIEYANNQIVIYNSSNQLLVKMDNTGFTIYDPTTGEEISILDNTGISVFGQGFSIWDEVTRELLGYLGYGIAEAGNNIVLTGYTGGSRNAGIVLLPGTGQSTRIFGNFVKIPTGTSDPTYEGDVGSAYFNTSTNQLRIHNGTSWKGVTLT